MSLDRGPGGPVERPPSFGLRRARTGRMLGGVCAGLGRWFGVSPWLLRLAFVLGNFLPGPGLVVYVALWLALPLDD